MIKYFDLQRISESFEPELSETVVRVTRSGWYLQGEETRAFEEVFAGYCGTRYCIGVGNGLDALTLIFMAYRELGEMQPGDDCSCQYIYCFYFVSGSCRAETRVLRAFF